MPYGGQVRRFELVTTVAAPPRPVFDLSLRVETHTASMARSGERAVAGVTAGRLSLGDTVTWQARHFGVRWRMTSVISAWEPPDWFVDEQLAGPFERWRHLHVFEPDGHGGTMMRDVVEFTAPFGPLGVLAETVLLDWYLRRLIRVRNRHLVAVAEPSP